MENHILFPIAANLYKIRSAYQLGLITKDLTSVLKKALSDFQGIRQSQPLECRDSNFTFLETVIIVLSSHIKELSDVKLNFQVHVSDEVAKFEKSLEALIDALSFNDNALSPSRDASFESTDKRIYRRLNYPKSVVSTLKGWLAGHFDDPYPSEHEKMMLCNSTGLTLTQLNNWFINARRRLLPSIAGK